MKELTNYFYNCILDKQCASDIDLSVMLISEGSRKKIIRLFFLDADFTYVSEKFKERSKLFMTRKDISNMMHELLKTGNIAHSIMSKPYETMMICCHIFDKEIRTCWKEASRRYFKEIYSEAV